MSLASTIALIKLLIGLRTIINNTLDSIITKQNEENLTAIKNAIKDYNTGVTIENKSEAAEKVRDIFRNS